MLFITSPAFNHNESIPPLYTFDGKNINPPLEFKNIPENTKSLALIMTDPDAPKGEFTHWLLWNIKPDVTQIAANATPSSAQIGLNDRNTLGYSGPRPPSGIHHYIFQLYALDTTLDLPKNTKKAQLVTAFKDHVIEQSLLIGLYSHQ